ncbi:circadian clock protein PASD1 [Mesocricetus auratus]|uniref:Circadian clock protein PASD1 n=1 Tax=Mesocricetus auratus TaxID=10036 RepID=A0ABM2XFU3_MESAU|nr:circadian clock protein PASD1 [Mesocricetus auratus]
MGTSLLNILLNEEKEKISQKIILDLPLAQFVGNLTEFCCYVRRGNVGQDSQGRYGYRRMQEGRDKYEYVKFILYLQDSYDESFVFFGNYGPNSRNIWSSTTKLLWEQQYYLVGTISVLRTMAKSEHPVDIKPPVIVVESDDDSFIEHRRCVKRRRGSETERNCQAENVNMEHRESSPEVEIIDVRPAIQKIPLELGLPRTQSQSSICSNISINSNKSTTTSNSSTDFATSAALSSPYMVDPKNMLEPVDIEFEVGSEFLLSDSEEEQTSSEHREFSHENVKKFLEEEKGSNTKEHVIDETPGSSSDEDCYIIDDIEYQKGPKISETIVDQGQEHQKTVETAPKCPSPVVQPVRPEAVVEPMVRKDLPACYVVEPRRTLDLQCPLLRERFAPLYDPQVRTQIYDLSTNRSFEEELPSYRDIEEEEREREQCEYELAQCTEMFHNLPYEQPTAQMEQGQENQVFQPQDQVMAVINDLGPVSINFFGSDNSEYPQNETHRFWDNHVDHTLPMLHVPSTTPIPYQPVAATHPPLAATNPPLTVTYQSLATLSPHPSARSHFASSDYLREDGPHFVPPGQANSGYFVIEEDINPHP